MTAKQTTVQCPNCRQPTTIQLEQLFDVYEDPQAKQRLLSGQSNTIRCEMCSFQGTYPTVIVYHDPEKELLLSFVPPELGLPMEQQQQVVGPMITHSVNTLPQEMRKAYLLQPKTMLTYQTLIETVLEADGITKEMVQRQQDRLNLIQRLANLSAPDVMQEVAKQSDEMIDEEFFGIINQLMQNAAMSGNEGLAQRLQEVQEAIIPVTTYGAKVKAQTDALQEAMENLRGAGESLTRETLLDMIVKSDTEDHIRAYVSMIRNGMDYQFFQLLSDRIDRARGDGRKRLADLREKLLLLTQEHDLAREAQVGQAKEILETLITADDLEETLYANIASIDETFMQVMQAELQNAQQKDDQIRFNKLGEIVQILQALSTPPEMMFVDELMQAPDAAARKQLLDNNPDKVTSELTDTLMNLVAQVEQQGRADLQEQLQAVYNEVLQYNMGKAFTR